MKRLFLRAFVRNEWGVFNEGWTYRALADLLNEKGIKASKTDVSNAGRDNAPLVEVKLKCDSGAVQFLQVVLEQFPSFELFRVFDAEELEKARDVLRN